MAFEQKPGTGTLFKTDKKSDKHPDYRGKILDQNGKEWALAAWVKEGKKGNFLSLKMDEPRAKTDDSNELPF